MSYVNALLCLSSLLYAGFAFSAAPSSNEPLSFSQGTKKQLWRYDEGIEKGKELVLKGKVLSKQARLLVRIDHPKSHHYFSRFNHEQLLSQGQFTVRLDLDSLKTGHKFAFSADQIRRLYYAAIDGDIQLLDAHISSKPTAPSQLVGWDFGSQKTGAWGFYGVTPGSRWEDIGGIGLTKPNDVPLRGNLRQRNRPYHDALIRDGFEGIQSVTLPLKNGLWRVRLWTSDIGEWEYLPHPLKRKVVINEQTVLAQDLNADQWQEKYYFNQPDLGGSLASSTIEPHQNNSPKRMADPFWDSFMINRGNPIDAVVKVENEQLHITLESDVPAGTFLSAVIATPWNEASENIMARFDQLRKDAFIEQWPILPSPYQWQDHSNIALFGNDTTWVAHSEQIEFKIEFDQAYGHLLSHTLPITDAIWLKEKRILGRVGGQERALTERVYLEAFDPQHTEAKTGDIWYLFAKIKKAKTQSTSRIGQHSSSIGALTFSYGSLQHTFAHLPIHLPRSPVPVGIYMDYAPHLSWFSTDLAIEQSQCDYRFLQRLGVSGVAPALPTPSTKPESIKAFKKAIQAPLMAGLQAPFPAYTPLKRMVNQPLHEQISVLQALKQSHPYTLWSLADEPGLFIDMDEKLNQLNTQLADFLPTLRRYAQLNHGEHSTLVSQYSDVLINQGYGLNKASFEALKQANVRYYLYNLPNLRYASGLYLWRSKAGGFWQWHGRMPTAHPFDPTDGREDDVQFFLPKKNSCDYPTIRADLINMRTGINDLRWLSWLSQNANHDIHFAILHHELEQIIALDFSKKTIFNKEINAIIEKIKKLAQTMPLDR
ncbi:hypothetical protein [Marinomonas mediterranea]|uniref:Glycoside hydrolase 123 C-terminal domain-containing protein n=1 Tax=Marinomonas mediterranea (strain ATCC 700492 / JCM 21426 / NBRC 103028 / MMB-1) TaxID=717774 RepID=F2K2H4_MARM1|nr:hypothetical protein [Marinomonas mediterranea]ADZ90019.1 hypothetical protein Marme_0736 [Marinomonas mediterranea MMB-1]WCN16227.1 hypothetical protein GV053_03690 [Marinomonas mediterranea MMB-1]